MQLVGLPLCLHAHSGPAGESSGRASERLAGQADAGAAGEPRALPRFAQPTAVFRGDAGDLPGAPRICVVGPLPPPEGGMANQTRQLAELLAAEGLAVEVVRTNRPYSPGWVGRLRGVRAITRLVPYLASLWSAFGRCDVVHLMANSGWAWHLFAAPALWLAALRSRPVVVNYRGGEAGEFLARSSRWVRLSLNRAAVVVVPSGFLRSVFAGHGVATEVIANIVNLQLFTARHLEAELPAEPHVVVTRNLEAIYDNETAIRAVAILRNEFPGCHLSIAGIGPELARLREVASACGIADAVDFPGRLSRDQVAARYATADIALNPSRVDNMPNSVLEALACGVPVVSTSVGGVPYVVEHERSALLVDPGDASAMAAAMARLLRDRALARRIARQGHADVQQYGWPAVKPKWLSLYDRVVVRHPAERFRS